MKSSNDYLKENISVTDAAIEIYHLGHIITSYFSASSALFSYVPSFSVFQTLFS